MTAAQIAKAYADGKKVERKQGTEWVEIGRCYLPADFEFMMSVGEEFRVVE